MNMPRLFKLLVLVSTCSGLCLAGSFTYSYTGNFLYDNDVQLVNLNVTATSTVTIGTLSYAGGVNGAGTSILPGGFAPELTLFDSAGDEFAFDAGGTFPSCNGRGVDPVSGFCLDATIYDGVSQAHLTLTPGVWTVALTQQGNDPLGQLTGGFSQDAANGNDRTFTGTNAGIGGAKFLDPFDSAQRTSAWDLDIAGQGSLTATEVPSAPEPSTVLLAAVGLAWLGLRRTRA